MTFVIKWKRHYLLGILAAIVFRIISFPVSVTRETEIKMCKRIIAPDIGIFTRTPMEEWEQCDGNILTQEKEVTGNGDIT
jgi:hypothetical protein